MALLRLNFPLNYHSRLILRTDNLTYWLDIWTPSKRLGLLKPLLLITRQQRAFLVRFIGNSSARTFRLTLTISPGRYCSLIYLSRALLLRLLKLWSVERSSQRKSSTVPKDSARRPFTRSDGG